MKELSTLTGNKFQYKEHLDGELIVYPADRQGNLQDKSAIVITPYTFSLVISAIEKFKEIPMGASRDNPPTFSLGKIIKNEKQSPQQLSYLIPILVKQGICKVVKAGKAFVVKGLSGR